MSFETNFDSGLDNYSPSASSPAISEWSSSIGNPAAGSIHMYSTFIFPDYYGASCQDSTDTHLVAAGEDLYFNGRFIESGGITFNFTNLIFGVTVTFSDAPTITVNYVGDNLIPGTPGNNDSGWLQFNFNLSTREGKTINSINFQALSSLGAGSQNGQQITMYIDSVEFSTTTPAFDPNPPAASAKFYQGLNSLSLKSTLPISGVNPGAMAISPSGQTVVLGAKSASGQMIIYSSNPWSSWTNMSSGMSTGTPVVSVKYV